MKNLIKSLLILLVVCSVDLILWICIASKGSLLGAYAVPIIYILEACQIYKRLLTDNIRQGLVYWSCAVIVFPAVSIVLFMLWGFVGISA